MSNVIKIENAKEHNLKDISLKIPRNKLVVFTGVSGSGKSSLVFDTIAAEGQRQYIESLSTYARRFLAKSHRPDVDKIEGLSPTVIVNQKRLGRNPRSTVGTVTEVYTHLRLLYSRCGTPATIVGARLFSFNNPEGACPACKGLGEELILNKDRLIDWSKSLAQGAIRHSEYRVGGRRWNILQASEFFNMDKPLKDFNKEELDKLLYSPRVELSEKTKGFVQTFGFEGIVTGIRRRRIDKRGTSYSTSGRDTQFFDLALCRKCQGSRLNELASSVKVNEKTIGELSSMQLTDLNDFLKSVKGHLANPIIDSIRESLSYLIDIGVGYLSLNRSVSTLSGGESQRVKMARQLGNNLIELLYILDEPTIGLHPKDVSNLIRMLTKMRDRSNSVLVVEHDPAVINSADYIIDIGPRAGTYGGKVVFEGTPNKIKKSNSITGRLLAKKAHPVKTEYRQPMSSIKIKNANLHNLKDISVEIPTGVFVCVTGVAGSGKSTLISDVFAKEHPEAIVIDQSPVGRSARSNPATYLGVFDLIRKIFAKETKQPAALFSFNSKGACSRCKGMGLKKVEMHFLDSVSITCEDCQGQRYSQEALQFSCKSKTIAEVLEMTVAEAIEFFDDWEIKRRLGILEEIGLGYLELGQPLNTLSGGETQRIKLGSELHKKGNIYILDEPTTGLHMADIEKLVKVLNGLVDSGNTVITIEHNLDVLLNADWIIDLGPEGGDQGGKIVAQGTPGEVANTKHSHTGKFLKEQFVLAQT